jgi:uncharacterized protein YjiS (DUF1127 family)
MALVHGGKYVVGSSARARLLHWLIAGLQEWRRAAADRRHLGDLNDHNLRDLGLRRHDVDRSVPFRDRYW